MMRQGQARQSRTGRLAGGAALLLALIALIAVATGVLLAQGLWWLLPHLALCVALLLLLWHQALLNRRHMAMLDRLERSLGGLIAVDRTADEPDARAKEQADRGDAEALAASRIQTLDTLLTRR